MVQKENTQNAPRTRNFDSDRIEDVCLKDKYTMDYNKISGFPHKMANVFKMFAQGAVR